MTARTYGSLRLIEDGQAWEIGNVEPHVSIRLKQLFPRIPKQGTPPYRLPNTDMMAADLDWFMQRYPLRIEDACRAALTGGRLEFETKQAEMERILLPDYKPPAYIGIRPGQLVRHYQTQAIEILRRRRSLLLGDEGGLGKTYTAAAFLCAEPQALPAAVVCDPHMQKQWKEKIEAFTTLRVHVIKTASPFIARVRKGKRVKEPYVLPPADVYVFSVTQIAGWTEIFASDVFRSEILDEPQSLRTGTGTAKGGAAKVLYHHTEYHLGLTATPIYNYGVEMWNIAQFIDDTVLGSFEDFSREWCDHNGRISDPKALGTYLREQHFMLRRLKGDVGLELPKVSRIVEHVDYDAKVVASVEDLAHQLAIQATTGSFVERGQAARELDMRMRQITGVAKAPAVAQFVRLLVEAGEKVILWGWHREVYDIWLDTFRGAGLKPAMYTGSETAGRKHASLQDFLHGDANPLIMSLRSGAGIDELQHVCSTGVFGELDWSPGIHQQCIWRIDRDGQQNPVTAFFLVTDDGSDPPMMDVLGIKASEATQIVDPHVGVQKADTDTTNLQKLVQRYLDRKRSGKGGTETVSVPAAPPPLVAPPPTQLSLIGG